MTLIAAPRDTHRARTFLLIAVALVGFTMSLQMALNANFVADDMHVTGMQQGLLESVRESCGILALGVLALLVGMSEPRIAVMMLVVLSAGVSAYAIVPSFHWLLVASFVWSQGFHVWVPLPSSMALAISAKGHEGRSLGALGAAGAIGSVVALLLALLLNHVGVTIRPMWFVAGAAALLAAAACTQIPREIIAPRARLIIRKRYGLFYLLQFLEGWRKQIFIAFASFMLVKEYHTPIATMLLLFLAANTLGWFVAPLVGRCIDRFGERKLLLFYYMTMVAVFASYATVRQPRILYVLFVLDSVLFACTMALTTYVGRLTPPAERTATLSAGVAANHVASVMMPLVGGMLWQSFGYQWAFYAGAVMATLTLIPVMFIPGKIAANSQCPPLA